MFTPPRRALSPMPRTPPQGRLPARDTARCLFSLREEEDAQPPLLCTPIQTRRDSSVPPPAPQKPLHTPRPVAPPTPLPKGDPTSGGTLSAISSAPYASLSPCRPKRPIKKLFTVAQRVAIIVKNALRHGGRLISDYGIEAGTTALHLGFEEPHSELKITKSVHRIVAKRWEKLRRSDTSLPPLNIKIGKIGERDLVNIDHIVPKSRGGLARFRNAAACSAHYNQHKKGARMIRALFWLCRGGKARR